MIAIDFIYGTMHYLQTADVIVSNQVSLFLFISRENARRLQHTNDNHVETSETWDTTCNTKVGIFFVTGLLSECTKGVNFRVLNKLTFPISFLVVAAHIRATNPFL